MREATIAASLLIDFVGYLERQGLGAAAVCQAARLDPRWLAEPDARLPASAMERLWAASEALTGDADIGLHCAESYRPGALGIVGQAGHELPVDAHAACPQALQHGKRGIAGAEVVHAEPRTERHDP